jgi:outer membrane protein
LEHKAQAELLAASRQAEAAARDHFSRFRWSLARTDRLTQLVKTSQKALESTRIGFKVSGRTSADVLRAVDQLYANQQSLMRARYESLMSLLQLKAETGTLTLSEVAQVNALLTPDAAVSP